jgi:hypothetical protein
MADDKAKKPKINLKDRLAKTTQIGMGAPGAVPMPMPMPGPGGATPPPPSSDPGSNPAGAPAVPATATPTPSARPPVPMGIAPPMGLSPGIPIPPFAQQRQAPVKEVKQTAQAQTIKVEESEVIHTERKRGARRSALYALLAVIVGGGIGFVAGGSKSDGDRAKAAARGAAALATDVKAAGEKLKELEGKIGEASEKLQKKQFPDDLATSLSGIVIPFETANLDGKGVGGLGRQTQKNVLNFTSAVENLNKSRETLKNLVTLAKDPIVKAWNEEKTPMANFSVLFRSEGGRVVAELVPNKEPFGWKGDWAPSYTINKFEQGKAVDKKVSRYVKGEIPGNGSDPLAIPMDPKSIAGFTGEVLVARLIKAVNDMRLDLAGNQADERNPIPGLVKQSEDLAVELTKAARNQ